MTDSISISHGDMTGLTFCGARTCEIVAPLPIPSWLTLYNSSPGNWNIGASPRDNALIETTATVTIKRQLANYPKITSLFDIVFNIVSCNDTILNSTLMDMVDDTFITASTPHTQSYESILLSTTQNPYCGTLAINWY